MFKPQEVQQAVGELFYWQVLNILWRNFYDPLEFKPWKSRVDLVRKLRANKASNLRVLKKTGEVNEKHNSP